MECAASLTALSSAVRARSTSASEPAVAAASSRRSCRRAIVAWAAKASKTQAIPGGERMPRHDQGVGVMEHAPSASPSPGARHIRLPTHATTIHASFGMLQIRSAKGLGSTLQRVRRRMRTYRGSARAAPVAGASRVARCLPRSTRWLPLLCLRRFAGTTGGNVDDGTDGDRHEEEGEQREKVLSLGDGEHPHRWGEEVVRPGGTRDSGEERWKKPPTSATATTSNKKGQISVDRDTSASTASSRAVSTGKATMLGIDPAARRPRLTRRANSKACLVPRQSATGAR